MNLREAMETIVKDGLQNNQGNLAFEVPQEKIEEIVLSVTNNDDFLIRFSERLEDHLNDFLEDHADEFDIYED